jgi:hypothetical protein
MYYWGDTLLNVENLVEAKASEGSLEMTAALRERAVAAGWPADVIPQMSVNFDGSNLNYNVPDKAWDLEYGEPNKSAPTSVMRGLNYRLHGFMDEIIDNELLDRMVMEDEVFHG